MVRGEFARVPRHAFPHAHPLGATRMSPWHSVGTQSVPRSLASGLQRGPAADAEKIIALCQTYVRRARGAEVCHIAARGPVPVVLRKGCAGGKTGETPTPRPRHDACLAAIAFRIVAPKEAFLVSISGFPTKISRSPFASLRET